MPALSRAQSIVTAALVSLLLLYLAVAIGGPLLEYLHGPSPETLLLQRLAEVGPIALVFVGIAVFIMQRIGVLPTITIQHSSNYQPAPKSLLRNLAIWIVVALALVFLFNFLQASNGRQAASPAAAQGGTNDIPGLIINFFPIFLLIGVWIFFLRQMRRRRNNQPPDSTGP